MTEEQIQNVERGAKWLDENDRGWAKKIDIENLKMSSCQDCILGQLHGLFIQGLKYARFSDEDIYHEKVALAWAECHGFNPVGHDNKEAWLKEIEARTQV